MKTLLWLDDIRDPNDPVWKSYIKTNPAEIVWVKNFQEFTSYIESNDLPEIISFDHDLADEHYTPEKYWDDYVSSKAYQESQNYSEKTGHECAKWLVEYCLDRSLPLPEYFVHSMNPVGRDNILSTLRHYEKYFNEQEENF